MKDILIDKMNEDSEQDVKIRFNTNYGKTSTLKWRVLLNSVEYLVDDIVLECPSHTTQDIVKGDDGQDVEKFHISAKPKIVKFEFTNYDTPKQQLKVILQ